MGKCHLRLVSVVCLPGKISCFLRKPLVMCDFVCADVPHGPCVLKDVFTDMADLAKGHAAVHGKSCVFPVSKVHRSTFRVLPCFHAGIWYLYFLL